MTHTFVAVDGARNLKTVHSVRTMDGCIYVPDGNGGLKVVTGVAVSPETSVLSIPTVSPSPYLGRTGAPAFMLHPDGRIEANWHELMAMKNEYVAGTAPHYAWAAALWLARNTR